MEAAERKFFPKSERLYLKNDIDNLFRNGQSFLSFPLRIVYMSAPENNTSEAGISILISVPKKRIKRAVGRNRIKRIIRETYRLNKTPEINVQKEKRLHIAFMYISNEILPYKDMEKAMKKALKKIYGPEKT